MNLSPDSRQPLTPLEEVIQRLMEPDKHGEKGKPTRSAFGCDAFGAPVQRTLDALWKYAEGTAAASRDSKDHYEQSVERMNELELAARTAAAQLTYGRNGKEEAIKILRHAIGA